MQMQNPSLSGNNWRLNFLASPRQIRNGKQTGILFASLIIQFTIFKLLYPFPDFFSDSYSYIRAASERLNVNIWPIGYSRFLALFHSVSHSPIALNLFQYLFFELSALYFYFTILSFFTPSKSTRIILITFLFFNPLNLYLANFISSDGLFAALSLVWLTELIWIIFRPNIFHLLLLSLTCFIAFTFRYNAMYYPIIALPAFLLAKERWPFKIFGIALAPILIIPFIIFSSTAAKQMSGTPQFPPILGGWQWANNALYMREYVKDDSSAFPTPQMAELDQIARDYYRQVPPPHRELSSYVGNFFIKQWNAPLKLYMLKHYYHDSLDNEVVAWAKVAPLFKQYGIYLIKRHPVAFFQHYLLINSKNYILPPLEKLEIYNLGERGMATIAMNWFDYTSHRVRAVSWTFHGRLFAAYPAFFLLLNIFFGWNMFRYVRRREFKSDGRKFNYALLIISGLILTNAAFSIFANIVVFRYQIFPMITLLATVLILNDCLEEGIKPLSTTATT
jgi:hypothetical protein